MIDCILSQKNLEELKQKVEKEREASKIDIVRNESKRKDIAKELYEKAIVEDSLYNENLREEAARIVARGTAVDVEMVELKEMPVCMNIDSVRFIQSYNLETMQWEFRQLFLNASGYDISEMNRTGMNELMDGLM